MAAKSKKNTKSKTQSNKFSSVLSKLGRSKKATRIFAHCGLIVFGAVGAYVINTSSAAVPAVAKDDCFSYLGRVWKNGSCSKTCYQNAGSLVVASPYDYCSKAASNIDKSICDNKKRQFVYGVCLKEWSRNMGAVGYTIACKPHSLTYHVAEPYDYCK